MPNVSWILLLELEYELPSTLSCFQIPSKTISLSVTYSQWMFAGAYGDTVIDENPHFCIPKDTMDPIRLPEAFLSGF